MKINKLEFQGKVLKKVLVSDRKILFSFKDGTNYGMYHEQDCCESVTIDSIEGDLKDLIDTKIEIAEERYEDIDYDEEKDMYGEQSGTWSFYTLRSVKATVVITWRGESNGYYNERAKVCKLSKDDYKYFYNSLTEKKSKK